MVIWITTEFIRKFFKKWEILKLVVRMQTLRKKVGLFFFCLKTWILLLAAHDISCFSWTKTHCVHFGKMSAKYFYLNSHSLSVILSSKNGAPWNMQLSSACNSINCTSAFPYGHGVLSFAAEMLYTCHFITQQIKKMLVCELDSV